MLTASRGWEEHFGEAERRRPVRAGAVLLRDFLHGIKRPRPVPPCASTQHERARNKQEPENEESGIHPKLEGPAPEPAEGLRSTYQPQVSLRTRVNEPVQEHRAEQEEDSPAKQHRSKHLAKPAPRRRPANPSACRDRSGHEVTVSHPAGRVKRPSRQRARGAQNARTRWSTDALTVGRPRRQTGAVSQSPWVLRADSARAHPR